MDKRLLAEIAEHLLLRDIAEAAKALAESDFVDDEKRRHLMNSLLRWQHGGAHSGRVNTRPCNDCGAPIFFAETISGSWMPLESETVEAKEMVPSNRLVVSFKGPASVTKSNASVRMQPYLNEGQVWVNHTHVCGTLSQPKFSSPVLISRWAVNASRVEAVFRDMETGLRDLQQRLEPRRVDADDLSGGRDAR